MFELRFTVKANDTFDSIQEQIALRWGEHSVKKFDKRVYEVLSIISQSPFTYKSVDSHPNIRKAYIHKNCSIFYKVSEDDAVVILLFFWDNRQDPIL